MYSVVFQLACLTHVGIASWIPASSDCSPCIDKLDALDRSIVVSSVPLFAREERRHPVTACASLLLMPTPRMAFNSLSCHARLSSNHHAGQLMRNRCLTVMLEDWATANERSIRETGKGIGKKYGDAEMEDLINEFEAAEAKEEAKVQQAQSYINEHYRAKPGESTDPLAMAQAMQVNWYDFDRPPPEARAAAATAEEEKKKKRRKKRVTTVKRFLEEGETLPMPKKLSSVESFLNDGTADTTFSSLEEIAGGRGTLLLIAQGYGVPHHAEMWRQTINIFTKSFPSEQLDCAVAAVSQNRMGDIAKQARKIPFTKEATSGVWPIFSSANWCERLKILDGGMNGIIIDVKTGVVLKLLRYGEAQRDDWKFLKKVTSAVNTFFDTAVMATRYRPDAQSVMTKRQEELDRLKPPEPKPQEVAVAAAVQAAMEQVDPVQAELDELTAKNRQLKEAIRMATAEQESTKMKQENDRLKAQIQAAEENEKLKAEMKEVKEEFDKQEKERIDRKAEKKARNKAMTPEEIRAMFARQSELQAMTPEQRASAGGAQPASTQQVATEAAAQATIDAERQMLLQQLEEAQAAKRAAEQQAEQQAAKAREAERARLRAEADIERSSMISAADAEIERKRLQAELVTAKQEREKAERFAKRKTEAERKELEAELEAAQRARKEAEDVAAKQAESTRAAEKAAQQAAVAASQAAAAAASLAAQQAQANRQAAAQAKPTPAATPLLDKFLSAELGRKPAQKMPRNLPGALDLLTDLKGKEGVTSVATGKVFPIPEIPADIQRVQIRGLEIFDKIVIQFGGVSRGAQRLRASYTASGNKGTLTQQLFVTLDEATLTKEMLKEYLQDMDADPESSVVFIDNIQNHRRPRPNPPSSSSSAEKKDSSLASIAEALDQGSPPPS